MIRIGVIGAGKAFLDFVFPGQQVPYARLPENSRLQRAFKQHLLDGGQIYEYSGLLLF